jgi:very-short-patch-repair endonuclease
MNYIEVRELARRFRNHPTNAESKLWEYLRDRHLHGRKFLRQHPIIYQIHKSDCFFFIPDFYCHEEKLIIELDGGIHDDREEKDFYRGNILKSLGLTILRIKNEELYDMAAVLGKISSRFRQRQGRGQKADYFLMIPIFFIKKVAFRFLLMPGYRR